MILEDQSVVVDGRLCIIGRKDRSDSERADIQSLTKNLDKKIFSVVLDHQPNDYENEAASEVDLVLSGHVLQHYSVAGFDV